MLRRPLSSMPPLDRAFVVVVLSTRVGLVGDLADELFEDVLQA